ncbi:unnamed protein product [Brassica rapa subsp. narinosa]
MWLQWKLIGCDNFHRSEALQFFRRWRSERREKDMDGHEEESWINDFQLHFSGKFEHRNTGKIPHRLGKLRVLVSACILCFLIIYSLYNLIYVCKYISSVFIPSFKLTPSFGQAMCCSQESMIMALSVHRIHQDPNFSYSSIHPIASRTELVPIGDLNTYISNSNEQAHVFVKLGCVSPDIIGFIRYDVYSLTHGPATFVVFNKELTKLIKQNATTLSLEEMSGGGGQDLPRCLEDLAGKDYVFQIRITPCRFIPNQCTFTSAISDDIFFVAAATKLKSLTGKVDKQQQQPATRLMA